MTKKGLGRGLGALIAPASGKSSVLNANEILEIQPGEKVQKLALDQITPNPKQPRQTINPEKLTELAESIQNYGVVQPIVVRPNESETDSYQIIAGERRWRACLQLGLAEIPALVRDYSDLEIAAIALIENIQREDLNALEEAQVYRELMTSCSWTQEQLAQKIGKSRPLVANTLRLLGLPPEIKTLLLEGKLTAGHCRALLAVDNLEVQLKLAAKIMEQQLSVRQIEKMVQDLNKGSKLPRAKKSYQIRDWESRLTGALSSEVKIVSRPEGGGKIVIAYNGEDELRWMVGIITGQEADF